MQIDAHHHLWRYNNAEFAWIDDASSALRRDFTLPDLLKAMTAAKIDAAISVQARSSLEETRWLLQQAARCPAICGVVGWVPLCADALSSMLDEFQDTAKLVGFREMTQTEMAGYLDRNDVNRGVEILTERGFCYDLVLRAEQLEEATRFVDRHPRQQFILDHGAKPRIAAGEMEPWRSSLHALAQRENVACKISGMVTEADWFRWTPQTLRPYLDTCVEAFGPKRLLAGSDWPVCLLATSYEAWWRVLEAYFAPLSEHERQAIFGENALRLYRCRLDQGSLGEATRCM